MISFLFASFLYHIANDRVKVIYYNFRYSSVIVKKKLRVVFVNFGRLRAIFGRLQVVFDFRQQASGYLWYFQVSLFDPSYYQATVTTWIMCQQRKCMTNDVTMVYVGEGKRKLTWSIYRVWATGGVNFRPKECGHCNPWRTSWSDITSFTDLKGYHITSRVSRLYHTDIGNIKLAKRRLLSFFLWFWESTRQLFGNLP